MQSCFGEQRTILVVDDDDIVRSLTEALLKHAGYAVCAASGGREALEVFQGQAGIDLLLSDVVMPEMSGPELADRLRQQRPTLPVLLMSGYFTDADTSGPLGFGLLAKPFLPEDLLRRVRQELSASAPGEAKEQSA